MANIDLRFLCSYKDEDYIKCKKHVYSEGLINEDYIQISLFREGELHTVYLDKSTAIRFAKTLRTEINKITE